MRVVFDALGAPANSGGMRLHATRIVSTWRADFPDDELHLVAPPWAVDELRFQGVEIHPWPNESVLLRAPGQLITTAVVARRVRADAVVSLSPIVTPFSRRTTVAFQHDWRHIKNPREFGLVQRAYRKLWEFSSRWADLNACISEKARAETLTVSPHARTALIPNGFDDAATWENRSDGSVPGQIVTFGHHNNKRPELLIRALPLIGPQFDASLVVLGANGSYREELESLAREFSVIDRVQFPGFVTQADYERIVSSSALIALVSSDEGFGLPIAEAACLERPALITSDSGMEEIFGDFPFVADPDPRAIATTVEVALSSEPRLMPELPHTWSKSVGELRAAARAGSIRSEGVT